MIDRALIIRELVKYFGISDTFFLPMNDDALVLFYKGMKEELRYKQVELLKDVVIITANGEYI